MMKPAAAFYKASSLCHSLVRLVINWAFRTIAVIKSRVILLSTGILICLYGCNTKKKEINSSSNNSVNPITQSLEQKLTDSLFKYIHLTTFTQRDNLAHTNYVLYGQEVNNNKIGVVAIEGKKLLLFQDIKSKFTLTDTITFDNYPSLFKKEDLNGDYKEDFIVRGTSNMPYGKASLYIFICGMDNILYYRPDLNLSNISYNSNTKLVQSYWEDVMNAESFKEVYHWENDSLEYVEGAKLNYSSSFLDTVIFYNQRNNSPNSYKKLISRNAESIYDTFLFKTATPVQFGSGIGLTIWFKKRKQKKL